MSYSVSINKFKDFQFGQSLSQENLPLLPQVTKCGCFPLLLRTILHFEPYPGADKMEPGSLSKSSAFFQMPWNVASGTFKPDWISSGHTGSCMAVHDIPSVEILSPGTLPVNASWTVATFCICFCLCSLVILNQSTSLISRKLYASIIGIFVCQSVVFPFLVPVG